MKTDNPQDHRHSDYVNGMGWLALWLFVVSFVLILLGLGALAGSNRRLDQHRDYLCATAPKPELLADCKNYRGWPRPLTLEERIRELERLGAEREKAGAGDTP